VQTDFCIVALRVSPMLLFAAVSTVSLQSFDVDMLALESFNGKLQAQIFILA